MKFQKALDEMRDHPAGGGGCHGHLMACANYARMAGLTGPEFAMAVRPYIDDRQRKVHDSEIMEAYRRAAQDLEPATNLPSNYRPIKPLPTPEPVPLSVDFEKLPAGITEQDLTRESPAAVSVKPEEMAESFLQVAFRPDEFIFIGEHRGYAKPGAEIGNIKFWSEHRIGGPFFCCNPLTGEQARTKTGKLSFRCDAAVADHRHLVVEFDELSPQQQLSACKWLIDSGGVVAVTHSAGKSYHTLLKIDATDAAEYEQIKVKLKPYLVALGSDRACFNPSRLTRLPGAKRDDKSGNLQRLIYLNGKAKADVGGLLLRFKDVLQGEEMENVEVIPMNEWQEPEPLNPAELTTAAGFPVDALPDLIREAVQEYQSFGQQPMALVASSALAMVSLACQCHADVERAANLRGPISLNFLLEAESGERKTAADRAFSADVREWLREEQFAAEDKKLLGMAAQKAWEAKESGLLNDIKRCKDPDDEGALKEELSTHYKEKPDPIYTPQLFSADCNPATLMRDLSENPLHGMAVWSDEGGLVIGGDGGRDDNITSFIALLNVLWDGSPVSQRRISGNRTVDGRRLTVNIMAQKQVIQKLITGQNGLARGMGLLARFMLAAPPSTIGTRFFRESGPMTSVATFNKRAESLLAQQPRIDDKGRLDPPVLTLSNDAFDVWREFFNDVEQSMAPHGDLETVKDVASKTAENAARLAGCFHIFCNSGKNSISASSTALKTTLIDAETMQRACRIAMYYLSEARRIFGCIDTPPEIIDAEKLLAWWQTRRAEKELMPKGEIRREGPLRDTQRLNAALTVLEQSGHIKQEPVQGTKGINIRRNPLAKGGGHG